MNIVWTGLGKLGSVCAAVLSKHGHSVRGYDPFSSGTIPEYESDTEDLIWVKPESNLEELVLWADVIFVAVQTPHSPEYGGDVPAPQGRQDFEYSFLTSAIREVLKSLAASQTKIPFLAIVSTVLPGTVDRLVRPMIFSSSAEVRLIYNPALIAMGTTVHDFENSEMVILGADSESEAEDFYHSVYDLLPNAGPHVISSISTAELTKVIYNTYISQKIVFANMLMELCHKTGADCDEITYALSLASDRITSAKYLRGGVGDGGACHPRDLIAMSWLSQRLDLSVDLMGFLVQAREDQSGWLRDQAIHWGSLLDTRRIHLLGIGYKPGSPLRYGSPSDLLMYQLMEAGYVVEQTDPYVTMEYVHPQAPAVYVVMTANPEFKTWNFFPGSVVIDPHGLVEDAPSLTVIRLGRKT